MDAQVSIFDSTSAKAADAAAQSAGSRRARILKLLDEHKEGLAIFEIAEAMQLFDHQISGRFGEMERDLLIEKAGIRRIKPGTNCEAEVYRLKGPARSPSPNNGVAELNGYPPTLIMNEPPHGDQLYTRGDVTHAVGTTWPGMPYSRNATGEAGGVRLFYRVSIIECEGCGRPLKLVREKIGGEEKKLWRCGVAGCNRTWHLQIVREPGGREVLAMVMKTL